MKSLLKAAAGRALSFLGISGHQLVLLVALMGVAFFAGAAWKNGQATADVVEAVQDHASQEVRDARIEAQRKVATAENRILAQAAAQQASDVAAHQTNSNAASAARRDRETALAYLAKEQPQNVCQRNDAIVGGADLRRMLDFAAAAQPAGRGGAAAGAGAGSAGAAAAGADAPVRRGELVRGYLNLAELYRVVSGRLIAAQNQARELGLAGKHVKKEN